MSKHPEFTRIIQKSFQCCLSQAKGIKLALVVMAAALALAAQSLHAANVIQNPGFETDNGYGYFGSGTIPSVPGNWQWGSPGNGGFWVQASSPTGDNNPHSGNNFFKEWGAYQSVQTTNVFYQQNACLAGATYNCDFWQGSESTVFNTNPGRFGFAFVSFLDATGNTLALYSAPEYTSNYVSNAGGWTDNTGTYINWFHTYVTNQNDVVSGSVTGSVSVLTAPAGAHFIRFSWGNWQSASSDGGDFGLDDVNLNEIAGPVAPQITQAYPGNMLFASNYISFQVTSASSTPINTTNIQLTLDGVVVSNGSISFSGSSPDITAVYNGVSDNAWSHTATITAVDNLGLSASPLTFTFDTIHPAMVVEAEDYDFTNPVAGGGGEYYNNPTPTSTAQPNSYFGVEGDNGVDYFTSSGPYSTAFRPLDTRNINVTGDFARQQFLTAQATDPAARDWEIDNINSGDWGNYTRNYPAGTYNVYARVSGNGGTLTKVSLDNIVGGSVANNVGIFTFTGLGWGVWQYAPLLDNNGNLLPISFGGVQTLRTTLTPVGGLNENFFMLVPAVVGQPFFTSIYPTNGQTFATGNTLSFTVTSATAINASGVSIILNGQNVTTNPNTTITGGTTATVNCALLQSNTVYTAIINVTNAAGASATRTISFDTISTANFYVKMIDYDYNGGLYDTTGNGLTPYAYGGLDAVTNIDFALGSALNSPYRGPDGLHQEITSDVPLPGYTSGDWDVGNFNSGQWANYTRNYPAGKYFVFGRLAGYTGNVTLSLVTSGAGTTTQTLQTLGTIPTSATSQGWQTWNWCPMQNNGLPAVVTLNGVSTLRVTSGGNVNANYFMLVPFKTIKIAATTSGGNATISFPTLAGSIYRVLSNSSLTSGSWSLVTTVTGTGSTETVSTPASGGTVYFKVVSP
jgi:hypothetical protein